MPRLRSSRKRLRQSRNARTRNKAARSVLRTAVKKEQTASSRTEAEALLPEAISVIDKSRKKGVVHRRAASRQKSRLAALVNAKEE